jgi:hypothetical protein
VPRHARKTQPWWRHRLGLIVVLFLVLAAGCQSDVDLPLPPTPTPEGSAVYYVAPGGQDDAPGSFEEPFGTFSHALAQIRAGDRLYARGGVYEERVIDLPIRPGTSENPIWVQAWPGDPELVVIEGLIWIWEPIHVHFTGINVTWSDQNNRREHMVKFTGGHDWTFRDAEVWDARSYAAILVTDESADWILSGLYVHDTHPANGEQQDHLIYISGGAHDGLIERCVLANSPNGRAIKIGAPSEDGPHPYGIEVRYNTMYNNLGPSNVQVSYAASDVFIHHNVMQRSGDDRASVTGFDFSGENIVVSENVLWETEGPTSDDDGIVDAGDNLVVNPELADPDGGDFRPLNDDIPEAGHQAIE